jgi:hypothetical protein
LAHHRQSERGPHHRHNLTRQPLSLPTWPNPALRGRTGNHAVMPAGSMLSTVFKDSKLNELADLIGP